MAPYAQDCCSGKALPTYAYRRVQRSRRRQSRSRACGRLVHLAVRQRSESSRARLHSTAACGRRAFRLRSDRVSFFCRCTQATTAAELRPLCSCEGRLHPREYQHPHPDRQGQRADRQRCASSASSTTFALASQLLPLRADAPRAAGAATASSAAAPHAAALHCCMIMCTSRVY